MLAFSSGSRIARRSRAVKSLAGKRILLLSAYDAVSHRLWRLRLQSLFAECHWQQLALPARHFNWRIRGNSLQWALQQREVLRQPYDLLVATSMVDLASLRGLLPTLGTIPAMVYFHENQFVYPANAGRAENLEPVLVPIYSALSAEAVVFNSQFNRQSFLKGVTSLFNRLPDNLTPDIVARLNNSIVLPVPLDEDELASVAAGKATEQAPLQVVWNHRWEYDKGPELLLAVAEQIQQRELPVQMHIVGQQFRDSPAAFEQLGSTLEAIAASQGQPRGHFGYMADRHAYLQLLADSDVVLSTALHDFQGLALQEAAALRCTPIAPDALAYPEYLDPEFLYSWQDDMAGMANEIADRLARYSKQQQAGIPLPTATLTAYRGSELKPRYAEILAGLSDRK